jgi:tetratricopeptide (TPR) repeat protein
LGAVFLQAGRPEKAEQVYREDLQKNRENGWSLFGLMKSLEAQNKIDEAHEIKQRFKKAWVRADTALTASRIID